jgi:hypothetical protein
MPLITAPLVLNRRYEANSSSSGRGTFDDGGMDDVEMGVAGAEGLLADGVGESRECGE